MFIINESDSTVDYEFLSAGSGSGSGSSFYSRPGEWTKVPKSSSFSLKLTGPQFTPSGSTLSNLSASAAVQITNSSASETSDSSNPNGHFCRYEKTSDGWKRDSSTSPCPSGSACLTEQKVKDYHPHGEPGQIIEIPCEENQ